MNRPRYTLKQRWADALAANPREESTRPIGWGQALAVMAVLLGVLWVIEAVNVVLDYRLNRAGLEPRSVDGLWGVLTMPLLHADAYHLLANSGPFLLIGWVVMLAGPRTFAVITGLCWVLGGLITWVIGPSNAVIVGSSGLIFGWIGYVMARAIFSRRIAWIASAVVVLILFGTMFFSVIPQEGGSGVSRVSWQAHLAGLVAGLLVGFLLHPRKAAKASFRYGRTKA